MFLSTPAGTSRPSRQSCGSRCLCGQFPSLNSVHTASVNMHISINVKYWSKLSTCQSFASPNSRPSSAATTRRHSMRRCFLVIVQCGLVSWHCVMTTSSRSLDEMIAVVIHTLRMTTPRFIAMMLPTSSSSA